MSELILIAWRNARASLGRTAMTLLAVCLGVGFLAGSLAVTDTLARNISVLFSSQYESVDVVVRGEKVAFGFRADLAESLIAQVAALPGAASAAGVVEGFAQPLDLEGEPLGSAQQPGLGRTWIGDPQLQQVPLLSGRGPAASGEVVLDSTTAGHSGISPGDAIEVATSNTTLPATVVGIADVSSGTGSALTWFEPAAAQALLGTEGTVQEIFVAADGATTPEQLAQTVAAAVSADAEVLTGEEAAAQSRRNVEAVFGFFRVILLVFVGIGMIVCAFIVFNTFAVLTAQRTRQLATLRALGCSQRQVTGATLAEGFIIGAAGSALGVLLGYLGTTGLLRLIEALGFGDIGGGVVLRPATIAISVAAGLLVTLIGAYPAARAAGRMPPVSAMRQTVAGASDVSLARLAVGFVGLALAVVLLARGTTSGYPDGLADVGLGMVALLIGLAGWTRPLIILLIGVLAPGARRVAGLPGDLAGRNSLRDARRTTVTAGSLALGLALVTPMGILTSSTKATLDGAAETSLSADVLVLPVVGKTPMPATVTDQVRGAPGVAAASPILFDVAVIDFRPTFVTGVDPASVGTVIDLQMRAGDVGALQQDQLLVAQSVATSAGLRVGQEVHALFSSSGLVTVRIGGIFADNVYAGFFLMNEAQFRSLTGQSGVWQVYAGAADGEDPQAVRDSVSAAIAGTPNTRALTLQEYTEYQDQVVDQALAGIYFMLLFAIIVAIVGVANTIALSVSERGREIGMLRAIGMTRAHVARMIRSEAALTSIVGAGIGVVIGVYLGVSVRLLLDNVGFSALSVPVSWIAVFFVLAVLAGVLAAALPARRASRQNVLDAVKGA